MTRKARDRVSLDEVRARDAYLKAKREVHAFNPTQRDNHNAGSLLKGKGFQSKGNIQCASAI